MRKIVWNHKDCEHEDTLFGGLLLFYGRTVTWYFELNLHWITSINGIPTSKATTWLPVRTLWSSNGKIALLRGLKRSKLDGCDTRL